MRKPIIRRRIGAILGSALASLVMSAWSCGLAHGQTPAPMPDTSQSTSLEGRLRRV
jgi:hypothetical protein